MEHTPYSPGTHYHFNCRLLSLIISSWYLFCVVPADSVEETFGFITSSLDTVSPWGGFTIGFSEQLRDTTNVRFVFSPPFHSYDLLKNDSNDTLTLDCTEPLSGDCRYMARIEASLKSENGAIFEPSSDSIVFHTWPLEHEPNDAYPAADTLNCRSFGLISVVNDTDRFIVLDKSAEKVYIRSVGSRSAFLLADSSGVQAEEVPDTDFDTLSVPSDIGVPFYIAVFALQRSVGGHYEIGIIR